MYVVVLLSELKKKEIHVEHVHTCPFEFGLIEGARSTNNWNLVCSNGNKLIDTEILQTTFLNAFLENNHILIQISLTVVPR